MAVSGVIKCLIYVLIFLNVLYSKNIEEFLTKRSSILWFRNQTQILNPNNHYCSICCVDMRQREKGRKCGIHTMCLYETKPIGAICKGLIVMEFSKSEIDMIIDIHNTMRNKVAMGMETQGDPGPQPPAANMRIISWDDELANVSARWASQCIYSYDKCRDLDRFPVGQNIAKASYASKSDWEHIVGWYELVEYVNTPGLTSYTFDDKEDIGHYTQVVWADTYLVGCARVCFQKAAGGQTFYREHFICNYGPSGNIPGQPVYKIGEPCSACLEGTGCNNAEYPALCGNELISELNFTRRKKKSRALKTKGRRNKNNILCVNVSLLIFVSFCYII